MNESNWFLDDRNVKIIDGRFQAFEPILSSWTTLFSQSLNVFDQTDDSYFLESGLTSMLSTAAWQEGKKGLIEVKTPKNEKGPRGSNWNGRCDLAIVGDSAIEIAIEAKLEWFWDNWKVGQLVRGVDSSLADADYLPNTVIDREVKQKAGVLYCLFWFKEPESRMRLSEDLTNVLKDIKPSFVAWDLYRTSESTTYSCAGSVLIGKSVSNDP